jgi:hypothetical protein
MKRTISEGALTKRQKQSPAFFFDLLAEHGNLFQVVCMHLPFQTFARLARINPFYRNLITNCTPAKIDQWLDLYAHEKNETERLVYVWRAHRMFVDKQINQIQYTQFIEKLYCDTSPKRRPRLKNWHDVIWGGKLTRQQLIRCRLPDEAWLSEGDYFGCEMLLLGCRPATIAIRYNKNHHCEITEPSDMDISLFQWSCPDHILMSKLACDTIRRVIYNVPDFALLETMPYFFKMKKFLYYRKTSYTAAMISKLGTPSEYFDMLKFSTYFPPFDLIKWLHSAIADIDFNAFMRDHFNSSDVFPCFNDSIYYLMNNHCIDNFIEHLTTTGKINKRGYAPLKSAIESMPK